MRFPSESIRRDALEHALGRGAFAIEFLNEGFRNGHSDSSCWAVERVPDVMIRVPEHSKIDPGERKDMKRVLPLLLRLFTALLACRKAPTPVAAATTSESATT